MSQAAVQALAILAAMDASPQDAAALLLLSGQRPAVVLQVSCQRPEQKLVLPARRTSAAERSRIKSKDRPPYRRNRR